MRTCGSRTKGSLNCNNADHRKFLLKSQMHLNCKLGFLLVDEVFVPQPDVISEVSRTHHVTVLYCTVLYSTVLYCTVLYSTCWCGHSAWGSTWWPRAGPGSRTRPGQGSGQLPPHSGTSSPSPSPCSAPRAAGGPAGTSPSAGHGRASCTYLSFEKHF